MLRYAQPVTAEHFILTIEGSFAIGVTAGLLIGFILPRPAIGCLVLLVVPAAMIFFISWWQGQHPENLRSTSGLDFIFGPVWPSLGAVPGYFAGMWLRSLFDKRA